jgi:hypothetical protein
MATNPVPRTPSVVVKAVRGLRKITGSAAMDFTVVLRLESAIVGS